MLQHIFKTLLLAGLALMAFAPSAKAHDEPSRPLEDSLLTPPPPAPTNLVITSSTATTISLQWSAPSAPFFSIRVIDVTGSQALPMVTGSGDQVTIGGLQPGHLHHMYVRVAYERTGPFSESTFIEGTTGYIIVDKVIGLQRACKPDQSHTGKDHTLCVKKSTSSNPAYYDNGSVGRILYGDTEMSFAVVYTTGFDGVPELHMGELSDPDQKFLFQSINTGTANCYYKASTGQPILMFEATTIGFFGVNESKLTLKFSAAFIAGGGLYYFCTSCGDDPRLPEEHESTDLRDITKTEAPHAFEYSDLNVEISPNPFTDVATARFSLKTSGFVSVQLFDAMGQVAQTLQAHTYLDAGEYTATVNGSNLPGGTYFLVTQTEKNRQITALIKQQ